MLVQDVDEQGWLWFLTDRSSRKACELSQNPHAAVLFQSPHGDRYVSVHGTAVVVKDDLKVRRIWNPTYRAWFPRGRRDPEIVLIAVRIARVDYWVVPRTRLLENRDRAVLGTARILLYVDPPWLLRRGRLHARQGRPLPRRRCCQGHTDRKTLRSGWARHTATAARVSVRACPDS